MQAESKIPVFVFPHKLIFVLEDKVTHKQVLTLYNPYNFSIKYRVLGTSPGKYIISNPEGTVPSHYRVDIVIRHNAITSSDCDVADKFRIQLYNKDTKQITGRQDVQSILRSNSVSSAINSSEGDKFQFIPQSGEYKPGLLQSPINVSNQLEIASDIPTSTPNYVILTIAVICICGLFLPTEKEESFSNIHISIALKLIFSYVLGLVTMVILKP